jgi:signal transduction histidine kinase
LVARVAYPFTGRDESARDEAVSSTSPQRQIGFSLDGISGDNGSARTSRVITAALRIGPTNRDLLEVPVSEMLSVGSFDEAVAARMRAQTTTLASRWLSRLTALLPVDANDVFPGERLLDHIPAVVAEIAEYIVAPEAEEIAANTAVIDKARELGLLRYEQQASLHQLLREYELLAEILETFVAEETFQLGPAPALEALRVTRRVGRAVRALMRVTVETFVAEYTKTLSDQQRKLESFRNMVSHELRNPIGALMFGARLLASPERQNDPMRAARALDAIERNAERLVVLINNLQRLSGDVLADDRPTEQLADIGLVAADVVRQLRQMAEARNVEIIVSDSLPTVVTDPARVELVLVNLISNAVKYSDPSKAARLIEISRGSSQPGWWSLTVSDNGLGIPAQAMPSIFERFTRAHAERDGELAADGSGLGLAIVKESVDALSGVIACQSTVGAGTVFELRVPLRAVDAV